MVNTGPQRIERTAETRTYLKVVRWVVIGLAFILFVVGVVAIAFVAAQLHAPSVFMTGVACLIVAAIALALMVGLDMHRATIVAVADLQRQMTALRARQEQEIATINSAVWAGRRRES